MFSINRGKNLFGKILAALIIALCFLPAAGTAAPSPEVPQLSLSSPDALSQYGTADFLGLKNFEAYRKNVSDEFFEVCKTESAENVRTFIETRGIDVKNLRSDTGRTAHHFAAENPNSGVADVLLAHGAPLGIQDRNGNTELHIAARHLINPKVFAEYLSYGNLTIRNKQGRTPLDERKLALANPSVSPRWRSREMKVFNVLAPLAPQERRNEQLKKQLNTLIRDNLQQRVKNFLKRVPYDLNAPDVNGMVPLMVAVSENADIEIIRALMDKGADPNKAVVAYDESLASYNNHSPVSLALMMNKQDVFNAMQEIVQKNVNTIVQLSYEIRGGIPTPSQQSILDRTTQNNRGNRSAMAKTFEGLDSALRNELEPKAKEWLILSLLGHYPEYREASSSRKQEFIDFVAGKIKEEDFKDTERGCGGQAKIIFDRLLSWGF